MVNILKLSKIKTLIKRLYKFIVYLLYRKNIIILMGDKGTVLCAIIHDKMVGSLFIPPENQDDLQIYQSFFNRFKTCYVSILLDGSKCEIRHDLVPVLHSIVKVDPVKNFIEEYFAVDDIVGYNVYNINTSPSEVWNTLIISTPYAPPLSKLLEHLLANNKQKFAGIYFLALEFQTIIDKVIKTIDNSNYEEHLQIFLCVLASSGIKLIVKHQRNLISIQTFDYPTDKSEIYIQGIIEQQIEDCLISHKNYINNLNLKVCIIFIVNQRLKSLLKQSNFSNHQVIYHDKIMDSSSCGNGIETSISRNSCDIKIIKLFNEQKSFLASNKYLKSIARLNALNSLIFKPFVIIIVILILVAGVIKIKTMIHYQKLNLLQFSYLNAEQNYYNIKQSYPYIQNATNLADIYAFEALLQIPTPTPFMLLKKWIEILPSDIYVEEVKWEKLNLDDTMLSSNQYIEINILLKLITNNTTIEDAIKLLQQKIANFREIFTDMDVNVTILTDQILDLPSNKIVIPAFVLLSKKKG